MTADTATNASSANGTFRRRKDDIKSAAEKPTLVKVLVENIPSSIRSLNRWVCWRWEKDKKTKWTKPPYNPRTGTKASSTNPDTWVTLEEAVAAVERGEYDGIGFCLGDGWAGIDLDDCVCPDTLTIDPWALVLVRHLNTYTEISPSRTGLKMLVRAGLPPKVPGKASRKLGSVEFYDSDRYFTVTGHRLREVPSC
jgi:putative DNA primase/helicase